MFFAILLIIAAIVGCVYLFESGHPTPKKYHKVHILETGGGYVISVDRDCTPEHLANTYRLFLASEGK